MALFSIRNGYVNPRNALQFEEASEHLRISVYNAIYQIFGESPKGAGYDAICKDIWDDIGINQLVLFPITITSSTTSF